MLNWDQVVAGTKTGENVTVVTDRMVDDYIAIMDLDHQLFFGIHNEYGRRVVPPDFVPKLSMEVLVQHYCEGEIGENIRAKQYFQFVCPVFVGDRVKGSAFIYEKYERRGKRFVTFQSEFRNEAGDLLIIDRRTQLILGSNFSLEKK